MRSLSKKRCGEHIMVYKTFILTDKIEFVPDENFRRGIKFQFTGNRLRIQQNIRIQHLP